MSVETVLKSEEKRRQSCVRRSDGEIMEVVQDILKFKYGDVDIQDRFELWSGKAMHRQFLKQTEGIRFETESELWPNRGYLKRETESLIAAAQEKSLRTNYSVANIDKDGTSPIRRMCH